MVFIGSVLAISWGFEAFIIANGGVRNFGLVWIVALMCIPGALAIVLRLTLQSGFGQTQAELKTQAKITQAEAEKTALAKVPYGKIKAAELEKEHGKLIWSFDISMPKSKSITEIQVDAKTGKIVSTQVETPKDQAAESRR